MKRKWKQLEAALDAIYPPRLKRAPNIDGILARDPGLAAMTKEISRTFFRSGYPLTPRVLLLDELFQEEPGLSPRTRDRLKETFAFSVDEGEPRIVLNPDYWASSLPEMLRSGCKYTQDGVDMPKHVPLILAGAVAHEMLHLIDGEEDVRDVSDVNYGHTSTWLSLMKRHLGRGGDGDPTKEINFTFQLV